MFDHLDPTNKGSPHRRPQAVRSSPRLLVPSSSPPLPSSSPLASTPPVPSYTDDNPSIRRASTDSDRSIFSHFSLTWESEAGMRAYEQVTLGSGTANTVSPNSAKRWVVFRGRIPGVYHTAESARAQTDGIPHSISLSYLKAAHAERDYKRFKADGTLPPFGSGPWVVYVGRSTGVFTDLGSVKAAIDDHPDSHYVSCTSLAEANEMYSVFQSILSQGPNASQPASSQVPNQLSPQPPVNTSSNPGGQRGRSHAFQPFILDEPVRNLAGHESWWVTWVAVRPGVYFGMDELLAAGPRAGGYRSVEDEAEGFEFLHMLVQCRLIRKLQAPPSDN